MKPFTSWRDAGSPLLIKGVLIDHSWRERSLENFIGGGTKAVIKDDFRVATIITDANYNIIWSAVTECGRGGS